jgi:UDP-N-acetylglucosamine 2-epimerase (non-hydrolysing)
VDEMKKVMSVFGTRPEAIKMIPVIKELEKRSDIESIVCVTGQHLEMLHQVLNSFDVKPDYDLKIMKNNQTLGTITSSVIEKLSVVLEEVKPDLVLVHGDTTTTFSTALSCFYHQIDVGHVEAGLRTFNKYSPFPEEINRTLTSELASIHFAPTAANKKNLNRQNIKNEIFVTGNTAIDVLKYTVSDDYKFKEDILNFVDYDKKVILLTAHRRENLGEPLEEICEAVKMICELDEDIQVIYPVHLNPKVRETVFSRLDHNKQIMLIDPIDVFDMHNLIARSLLIMTDSGGLQEEAPSLNKPVVVLREVTERTEAVRVGTVTLGGTDKRKIFNRVKNLLINEVDYELMANKENPYGDGLASVRIVDAIIKYLK